VARRRPLAIVQLDDVINAAAAADESRNNREYKTFHSHPHVTGDVFSLVTGVRTPVPDGSTRLCGAR
jgi:hypothetical protein